MFVFFYFNLKKIIGQNYFFFQIFRWDSAGSHSARFFEEIQHLELRYFPAGMTAHLQPVDVCY